MQGIKPYKISKLMIYVFLIYMFWFKNAYSVKNIILYSSVTLAAACMFYDLLVSHQSMRDIFPPGVLINIVMCVYSLLFGLLGAKNQEHLVSGVLTYTAFSVVCLVICYISHQDKSFTWLLNGIIATDILCAAFCLFRGYHWPGYGYVLGPENNPNVLGMEMVLGLFCLTYLTLKDQKRIILYDGLGVLFLYTIVNCGSRKCLVAAIIICSIWIFHQSRKIWRNGQTITRIFLLIVIALLIFAVFYYYQNVYKTTDISLRMEKLGDKTEESSRNRMLYYRFAIEYFLEKPLFGIGLQQFRYWNPYGQYAHSTYAEAVADWGFFGCLIYFTPMIWAAVKLIKQLIYDAKNETTRSLVALLIVEIFLGVGQIWFYEIEHLIAWTIIFLFLEMTLRLQTEKEHSIARKYKYIKA